MNALMEHGRLDREVRDKTGKRRIKAAIAKALDDRTDRYLRNQGKRSNWLLRSQP